MTDNLSHAPGSVDREVGMLAGTESGPQAGKQVGIQADNPAGRLVDTEVGIRAVG